MSNSGSLSCSRINYFKGLIVFYFGQVLLACHHFKKHYLTLKVSLIQPPLHTRAFTRPPIINIAVPLKLAKDRQNMAHLAAQKCCHSTRNVASLLHLGLMLFSRRFALSIVVAVHTITLFTQGKYKIYKYCRGNMALFFPSPPKMPTAKARISYLRLCNGIMAEEVPSA